MVRIEGTMDGTIDVKRFHMDGIKAYDVCIKCSKEVEMDYSQEYLSYPRIGVPEKLHFYCEDCDHDWRKKVIIGITIEALE